MSATTPWWRRRRGSAGSTSSSTPSPTASPPPPSPSPTTRASWARTPRPLPQAPPPPRLPFPVHAPALVHADHLGRRIPLSPAHILSMLLAYLKQLAEADLEEGPVADCVISAPCYFTQAQRRAYADADAAAVAGLWPLRLMHDLAATALCYGLYRSDLGVAGGPPTYVAFVDVDHPDTQAGVVAFDPTGMKVLSHGFDADLGGRDFDEALFEHFAAEFRDRYEIDVAGSVKASMRLRAACEKAKKVLSANAEAVVNIECLMEEKM